MNNISNPSRRFNIIPAIDLKDGCCVRLRQGMAADKTVYSDDPVRMALHWEEQGAELLHVVDLDGAFQGRPIHADLIKKIVKVLSIPVQTGGGLRTKADIRRLLDCGVSRAIIGTSACRDDEYIADLTDSFPEQLAVGIDARDGQVRIKGWTESTTIDFLAMAERISNIGVKTLIYTNTALDGMLQGPDAAGVSALCHRVTSDIIASGGISSTEHIAQLSGLQTTNLIGAIVGKALYDGSVTLKELIEGA